MDLSSALWSRLPFEVMDHVLLFLPVQDLCRYRTVCKRWNRLISTPGFGALVCAQNSKHDVSFVVMSYYRYYEPRLPTHGWWFLDLKARRWYTIKNGDLDIRHHSYSGHVGMDGGLVCQFTKTHTILEDQIWTQIMVYNPIGKTMKELPIVPDHMTSDTRPMLLMVVDNISLDFKILLINYNFDTEILEDPTTSLEYRLLILNDPLMRIYDSATKEWRSSTNPSCIRDGVGCDVSGVVFQGLLYLYLKPVDESEHPLWRYDFVRDAWERLTVVFPTELVFDPELIVSANRLFLVAWSAKRLRPNLDGFEVSIEDDDLCFKVFEIKIPDMIREMVLELSKENMTSLFDKKIGNKSNIGIPDINVFAFGTSLMLFSNSSGNSIVYDLVTGLWDYGLPQNPMGHGPNARISFVHGKQMNLLLPSTLW